MNNWKNQIFPDMKNINNPEKTLLTCKTWKFYLGMFKYNTQEYCYDWVKTIIKNEIGEDLQKKTIGKNKKKTIPKQIKNEVWDYYFGKELGIAKCYCCKKVEISKSDFHAGHYISEFNNGKANVNNLRPICSGCNFSMGKKNMEEYVNNFYRF